jgi:hypothetical protein
METVKHHSTEVEIKYSKKRRMNEVSYVEMYAYTRSW